MSITLSVSLLSGRTISVETEADVDIENFKQRAQSALSIGRGILVHSNGPVLYGARTIRESGLQTGDVLTVQVQPVTILAARRRLFSKAFAAILGDRSVVTWGGSAEGGDSSHVQQQLRNVKQMHASDSDFAAILGDGSVVTWGNAFKGGDSSAVQDQLRNVQQIQASGGAFAAILNDGRVATWGNSIQGGDSSAVQEQLSNVQQVQANPGAFAAILGDGSVVSWGLRYCGGGSSAVQHQLKMCSTFKLLRALLLQSLPMAPWLLGAACPKVATVVLCKISCGMYGRFKALAGLLLPSLVMALW